MLHAVISGDEVRGKTGIAIRRRERGLTVAISYKKAGRRQDGMPPKS